MRIFSCDFETTTKEEDCRVWASGIYDIDNDFFECGNSIEWLFKKFEEIGTCKAYFHNLKFDGAFILDYLFREGYTHTFDKKLDDKEFSTLISDSNLFYSFKIKLKKGCIITILDSLKAIPFSVKKISKAFGLKQKKGEIDYHAERPIGYKVSPTEHEYIKNDCEIVGKALNTLFSQDLRKMTQGSNALYDFKKSLPRKFEKIFPKIEFDSDIRAAYKGGFTYVNPKYKGIDIEYGKVYDKNSMYPSMMKFKLMPYGDPIAYDGKYKYDKLYPLYIQKITAIFEIKKEHIPTIQIKSGYGNFIPTEYIESSNNEEVTLTLTSIDLELFKEQYEIIAINYIKGWKFKGTTGLFDNYIDKWYRIKEEASRTGNEGMRTLAKLMLNALYGKFATSTTVQSKIPYYDYEERKVRYKLSEKEEREPVYLPVACFITAYSREDLIKIAQKNYNRFAYSDTDSIHLEGHGEPIGLEIDNYKIGAWSLENIFHRARFLRAKCYIEEVPERIKRKNKKPKAGKRTINKNTCPLSYKKYLKVTCAGMPYSCHSNVNWNNFQFGAEFEGKKRHKTVSGGAVLVDTPYKLKFG